MHLFCDLRATKCTCHSLHIPFICKVMGQEELKFYPNHSPLAKATLLKLLHLLKGIYLFWGGNGDHCCFTLQGSPSSGQCPERASNGGVPFTQLHSPTYAKPLTCNLGTGLTVSPWFLPDLLKVSLRQGHCRGLPPPSVWELGFLG